MELIVITNMPFLLVFSSIRYLVMLTFTIYLPCSLLFVVVFSKHIFVSKLEFN